MSRKLSLSLDDDDDELLAERIGQTARQQGIPSLTPPPKGNGPRRPIKIEVSEALFEALTIAAAQQRVTKRYLILSALRNGGFPVDSADFLEDGRRLRGSRKE